MDWRALLRNKWALGGVAVVGVAGVVVFLRRRSAGGASSAPATGAQASPGYSGGAVGTFDSTGTDVANWLGHYSDNLDSQFKEFRDSVRSDIQALQTVPSGAGSPPRIYVQSTAGGPVVFPPRVISTSGS